METIAYYVLFLVVCVITMACTCAGLVANGWDETTE